MTNVCMIVFSFLPSDVRVQNEAEALVEKGFSVDIMCLRDKGEAREELVNGVNLYRLPLERSRKGILSYLLEYISFIVLSFFKVNICHLKKKYKIIHVHNMPDILVFSALIQKLMGVKIVLDLHDPMPEVYMTKYSLDENHHIIRLLKYFEKISIWFADLVITPNIAFRDLFIRRGCPEKKIHIVMNSPKEEIFSEANTMTEKEITFDGKFVIMFHGTIVERHGLDTALEALVNLKDKIPNIVFIVFGSGDYVEQFLKERDRYKLNDIIHYYGHVSNKRIASIIRNIDLGLIPNKPSTFTNLNLPTRIFEYLCMGKPVIVSRTKGSLDYFKEDEIYFFDGSNSESLAKAVIDVYKNLRKRVKVVEKGMEIYKKHTWRKEREQYVTLIEGLIQS